ncbi:hypothetical protein SAMN05661099_0547 [Daejeonella lutea]|uniref:Uncharacterized protein n=1 Tax=Daejeonella lutea TaxID=572036 RepID=A0A1T5ABH4_9SPHI|nr:hypothetical protein SAMN05661099_0547 [Daejeonella lutea]
MKVLILILLSAIVMIPYTTQKPVIQKYVEAGITACATIKLTGKNFQVQNS